MKILRKRDNVIISCYVDAEVKKTIEVLARKMGISLSEYLRRLVIDDLDKRSFFTSKLKEVTQK